MEYGDTSGIDAINEYQDRPRFKEMYEGSLTVWASIQRHKSKEYRQRFETATALVGIVSFWRRVTNMPDSKAAQNAAKRFKSSAAVV